jgi:anti-anti-sigma factor
VNLLDEASSREPLRAGEGWILRGVQGDVVLSGMFDVSTTGVLRAELLDAVSAAADVLTVDVREVTFLDASTVHVLVEARNAAAETGRNVRLLGAGGVVSRVLRICGVGLDLVVDPVPDGRGGAPRRRTPGSPVPNVPAEWRGPGWPASPPAPAAPDPAPGGEGDDEEYRRVAGVQRQRADDARARSVRRALLARFRGRLGRDPLALADDRFLGAADRFVVLRAIVDAAMVVGGADRCALQLYDQESRSLRIAQQHGFGAQFLDYFATVDAGTPTSGAAVIATGRPMLVDDITQSPIFAGRPSLPVMLAAGTRAVRWYPLRDHDGRLLGVLSFHYSSPGPHQGNPEFVAYSAAMALAHA